MVALTGDRHCEPPEVHQADTNPAAEALYGTWPRTAPYWDALVQAAPGRDVVLVWGGNEHNMAYFFQAAYEFDFLSKQVKKLIPGYQIMPQGRIRQRFLDLGIADLGPMLERLRAAGAASVRVLGTPPPKRDNEALRAMLESEPFFVAWAGQIGQDLANIHITLPHIRLKLWFLLQDLIAGIAAKANVPFLPVPAEAQDDEGFLRTDYWHPDVTHANHEYGALMLRKVLPEQSQ